MQEIKRAFVIPEALAGQRLDQALAEIQSEYSRSRLSSWIKEGKVTVNGQVLPPKTRVDGGEQVVIETELEPASEARAEAIPLDIVYQDDSLLIVNKPAGMVVHPAAGNHDGTLQNALLHHDPQSATLPRAGIVHRLDKDTSGLLMVARTLAAHRYLVEQLQERNITREYRAVCHGVVTAGGTIDLPIGRHPVDRKRMAVCHHEDQGRPAVTHYRVEERFTDTTLLKVVLETGRTHQIRVHMAHMKMPLVGDPVYGGRFRVPKAWPQASIEQFRLFRRQALHAAKLGLHHPDSGEYLEWEAEIPEDMSQLLQLLRDPHDSAD